MDLIMNRTQMEEKIVELVKAYGPIKALKLARFLSNKLDKQYSKKEINSILYSLKNRKKLKIDDEYKWSVAIKNDPVNHLTELVNVKDSWRVLEHPSTHDSASLREVKGELEKIGAVQATEKAKIILENNLQVWVEELPINNTAFFEVSVQRGVTFLQINTNHVFYSNVLEGMSSNQRQAVAICLAGWARMERECSSNKRRTQLEMARRDWGQLLDDYLSE